MENGARQETSLGMDESFEALLCYILGWATGIVFLILEKNSRFVRFHAMQSLVTFLGLSVAMGFLGTVPGFGLLMVSFLWLLGVALWAILMWKAFKGEWFRLPLIGTFAQHFANKTPGTGQD